MNGTPSWVAEEVARRAAAYRAPTADAVAQVFADEDMFDHMTRTDVYRTPRVVVAPGSAQFIADDGEFEYVVTVTRRSSRG